MPVMMKCGHAANSFNRKTGDPACVICVGIVPGACEVDDNPPSFDHRQAKCSYGDHGLTQSSPDLAFFEHQPDAEFDRYYCGCHGWD